MATANPVYQSNTLYVGDLDKSVDETTLYNEFSSVGGVITVHVCTDRNSGQSLGYAYVNFRTIEEADLALCTLNFKEINGKQIRLMWSNRNPATRRTPENNLFIKNIPASMDSKALHNHFSTFGNIYTCKVATNEDGSHRGYGFVQMEKKEEAQAALEATNGQEIDGSVIEVIHYVPRDMRAQNWTNCYFRFLPRTMSYDEAMSFFTTIGPVTSLFLPSPRSPIEGAINAGYGFVNFADHETAVKAVNELNGHQFEEGKESKEEEETAVPCFSIQKQMPKRELDERRRQRKEERRRALNQRYAGRNIYVRNVPSSFTEDDLHAKFAPYGEVASIRLDRDYVTQQPTGVGYVCMGTVESAQRALELAGTYVDGKPLVVQLFKTKEERQREIALRKQRFGQADMFDHSRSGTPFMQMYASNMGNMAPLQQAMIQQQFMQAMMMMQQQQEAQRQHQMMMHHQQQAQRQQQQQDDDDDDDEEEEEQQQQQQQQQRQPSIDELVNMDPNARRIFFGERLFPMVSQFHPDNEASKITGILLEMEPTEIMHLIEDPNALNETVSEIMAVLQEHANKSQQTEQEA